MRVTLLTDLTAAKTSLAAIRGEIWPVVAKRREGAKRSDIITALAEHPGATATEIANAIGAAAGNSITMHLTHMRHYGYVEVVGERMSSRGRKPYEWALTARGAELAT